MAGSDQSSRVSVEAGQKVRDGIIAFLGNQDNVGLGVRTIANVCGAIVAASTAVLMALFGAAFRVASELAAIFLESLEGVVRDNQSAMNDLIAASMTDLLSVDIAPDDIGPGGGPQAQVDRAVAIGGKLLDLLEKEFTSAGSGSDNPGAAAAKAMVGFNINFSIRAALLSIITEIESLGFFKEFREIGEQMAQNLSLGRMLRRALQPLIQHTVALPYDRELAARYRQNRLTDREYIQAQFSGQLTADIVSKHLAEKGYTDQDMQILINMLGKELDIEELWVLHRFGILGDGVVKDKLQRQGYDEITGQQRLQARDTQKVDHLEQVYAGELLTLAKAGGMDAAAFQTEIQSLHFSDGEVQLWLKRLTQHKQSHRKALSVSEIIYLLDRNLMTQADVDEWATAAGYSEKDADLIKLYIVSKELDQAEREKIAKYRWDLAVAKAKAKGTTPPPAPPGV